MAYGRCLRVVGVLRSVFFVVLNTPPREQLLASVELGPVFKLRSSLLTAVYASLLRADGCLEELRGVQLELGGFVAASTIVRAALPQSTHATREHVRDTKQY